MNWREREELRNQTGCGGGDVRQACAASQLGFESGESEPVPLLWLGVLIRQLESDTTAGWSKISACVA